MPERRDVLPEPEVCVPSRVQGGAVPTLALRGGERVQRRLVPAPPCGRPAALRPAGPLAAHVNFPLSHEIIHTPPLHSLPLTPPAPPPPSPVFRPRSLCVCTRAHLHKDEPGMADLLRTHGKNVKRALARTHWNTDWRPVSFEEMKGKKNTHTHTQTHRHGTRTDTVSHT